jgi:flagellar motor switch protein FliN
MSDADSPKTQKPELQSWFYAWKTCAENVLSQVSGQPHAFEIAAEPLAAADSDLRYTIVTAGAVQGEMALRLPQLSAIRLARIFVGGAEAAPEAGVPIADDDREGFEELLRQIAGLAATAEATVVGGEVQFQLSSGEALPCATSEAIASLRTREPSGTEIAIEIRISPALATALASRAAASTGAAAEVPLSSTSADDAAAHSVSGTSTPTTCPADPHGAGYRRLLDVGLGVKLRFGTRRLLLRDVLALSSGLVVELDDELNSPVDLLLDGRIVAHGEVVVIDGKYGLRVTAVVDPQPTEAPHA